MSEQTPSMGGLHQPPEKIESLLSWSGRTCRWTSPSSRSSPGTSWSSARWRGDAGPSGGEKGKATR